MSDGRVFVFWTNDEWVRWIRTELAQGRLRQGWGGAGTELLDVAGRLRPYFEWRQTFATYAAPIWRDPPLTDEQMATRYSNFKSMLEMERGDLVLIPRVPDEGIFTIAAVSDGYRFDEAHFGGQTPPTNDGGHLVAVDAGSITEHGYTESTEAKFVVSRFQFYRKAITAVRNVAYATLIRQVHADG